MKLNLPPGFKFLFALATSAILVLFCGFANNPAQKSDATQSKFDVPVLFVCAPAYLPLAALKGEERFPQGAQIFLLEAGNAKPVQLIEDFFATADPSVSYDAKTILFTGKKLQHDPWKIYEYSFATRKTRPIFAPGEDAIETDQIRPLYLPHDRLVYARRTAHGFRIEAAQFDGTNIQPLTFIPASAIPVDVLADGRILFESYYPLGTGSTPEMFLVYSDGSGVESYRCDHPGVRTDKNAEHDASAAAGRWGGHQDSAGDVLFTHGDSLARFTSPLATEAPIAAPPLAYSDGPVEVNAETWLISAHSATQKHFSLVLYSTSAHSSRTLFADTAQDLVEPVLLTARTRPNHHPSGLHDWQYGNFLALDARLTRDAALAAQPTTVRVEALDEQGKLVALGSAPVEADGSFFVQTTGDTPVRFSLLDKDGNVLRAERGFIWIKKGEQRICVGCHTGPERASENKVPGVLLRTTTPVDLTLKADAIKEKSAVAGEK
jgi:hypothetical protein